jgi:hypothetical protein
MRECACLGVVAFDAATAAALLLACGVGTNTDGALNCRDAASVRRSLASNPPNARARFFRFTISRTGLAVNVC